MVSNYEVKEFDRVTSAYLSGQDANWEGKVTVLGYTIKTGAKQASMLQDGANYESALKKIGGKILVSEGREYAVTIVEKGTMRQDIVADAAALSASIAATGKAAVYGIDFDTGKSVVKPGSNPSLEEITKLLKQNGTLTLYVVGHTDNVGALDPNLKLSADRADAVVKALMGRGVAASRLRAAGVESNRTEAGKAMNRRVELVEQK